MTPTQFRAIRKSHWRTQAQAAEALGYTRDKTISEYENGRRPIPATVIKLLQYIEQYGYNAAILE